jgi:hypothetical protein
LICAWLCLTFPSKRIPEYVEVEFSEVASALLTLHTGHVDQP